VSQALQAAYATPLFGVAVTVIAYAMALGAQRRWRWLHPLVLSCGLLMLLLHFGRIPLKSYQAGGDVITFFLGPATIALGVPLYKQAKRIGRALPALAVAVALGSAAGVGSAAGLVKLAGGSGPVLRSMLPKSVTTPIAVELSRQIGGSPDLTSAFVVLAGVLGSLVGPRILRLCGVRGDLAIGAAVGTSSHGIGTARLVPDSELQAGVGGLSMALAGVFTALLMVPVQWFLR
jgi:predicted murein hydrolase (TIGR00659 family)